MFDFDDSRLEDPAVLADASPLLRNLASSGARVRRYVTQGAAGLVSRKRGRPSNHQLDPGLADRAIALIRQRYADFGPTLAREKLLECHGLALAKETLRQLMIDAGLWSSRRQRAPPIHQPRSRRACLGELVQIDGNPGAARLMINLLSARAAVQP